MALMDLADEGRGRTLSNKWSVSLFTNKKRNKYVPTSEISGIPKEDAIELTMEIAQLQQALAKYIASNERKGSSVRTSLTELELYIKELKDSNARPDFVTAAYSTKSDLLKTMDKFDDNTWKATLDAVKTKKDVRKFYVDKNKEKTQAVQTVDTQVAQAGGAVGTMVNVYPNGMGSQSQNEMRSFNPATYRPPIEVVDQPISLTQVQTQSVVDGLNSVKEANEVVDTPQRGVTAVHEAVVTEKPEFYKGDKVIQEGLVPSQNVTTSALNNEALKLYEQRRNMTLSSAGTTELGHDYNTSINGLMSKVDDIEPVMYINQIDGTYYVKAYYKGEDGKADLTKEYPYFNHPSLLHIENLEMTPSGDKIKCFAYSKGIPYKFVDSDKDMPDVYKNYWRMPEYQNYYIPQKTLENFRRLEMKNNDE